MRLDCFLGEYQSWPDDVQWVTFIGLASANFQMKICIFKYEIISLFDRERMKVVFDPNLS